MSKRLSSVRQHLVVFRNSFFVIKKVPPPTPDRREGRLFPPEQSWKTSTVLNELLAGGNKFLHEVFGRAAAGCRKTIPVPAQTG
jgi:hypothetical protein